MKTYRLANGECLKRKRRKRGFRNWTSRYKPIDRDVLIARMRLAMKHMIWSKDAPKL